jgi:hypothetical protein
MSFLLIFSFGAKIMATLMEFAAMQLERDGYSSRTDLLGPDDLTPNRPPFLHVNSPTFPFYYI